MKIKTKYHGETEIKKENIIHFPLGIPSFLEEKHFILLPFSDDTPFYILQSTLTENVAFVAINPFEYFQQYEFEINDSTKELLEIESQEDVLILSFLTVADPFEKTTANLQAPLVINVKKKIGKQMVLNEGVYTTKHYLFNQESSVQQGEK